MNCLTSNESSCSQRRVPLILVSAFALIFAIVSRLSSFLGYMQPGKLIFYFSPLNLGLSLFFIAPFLLLLLYVITLHKKEKGVYLLAVAFGLLTVSVLYSLIQAFMGRVSLPFAVTQFLLMCAYISALINSFRKFASKALIWVACCLLWLVSFVYIFDILSSYSYYLQANVPLYIWVNVGSALTFDLLGYWLLLFGFKKTAPPALSVESKTAEVLDAEKALQLLQEKLELGIIDNVEYQLQRADIIAKL